MKADLHCHSKISDGSLSSEELISLAKRVELTAISITNHDTMAGTEKARLLGEKVGIRVIPGAEISAWDYDRKRKVHLLCYMPDDPDKINAFCQQTIKNRQKAALMMLQKIMRLYPIPTDIVAKRAAGSTNIFKQHIMHALMECGYSKDMFGELYQKLFNRETGIAFFPVEYPDIREAVTVVREAGGVAILAHPFQFDSIELMEELTAEHMLDGIEAYHSRYDLEASMKLSAFAHDHQLLVTGGSDFHGMYSSRQIRLGSCTTPEKCLRELLHFKRERSGKE